MLKVSVMLLGLVLMRIRETERSGSTLRLRLCRQKRELFRLFISEQYPRKINFIHVSMALSGPFVIARLQIYLPASQRCLALCSHSMLIMEEGTAGEIEAAGVSPRRQDVGA